MQNAVAALIWLRKQKASETKLTVEGKALFKRALFKGDAVTRGTFGVEGTSSYEKRKKYNDRNENGLLQTGCYLFRFK